MWKWSTVEAVVTATNRIPHSILNVKRITQSKEKKNLSPIERVRSAIFGNLLNDTDTAECLMDKKSVPRSVEC